MYEGEINMVIHANGGTVTVTITPMDITMVLKDTGPGIPDIDKAMRPAIPRLRIIFALWAWRRNGSA